MMALKKAKGDGEPEEQQTPQQIHEFSETIREQIVQILTVLEQVYEDTDDDPKPEDLLPFIKEFLLFLSDLTPLKATAALEVLFHMVVREVRGYDGE